MLDSEGREIGLGDRVLTPDGEALVVRLAPDGNPYPVECLMKKQPDELGHTEWYESEQIEVLEAGYANIKRHPLIEGLRRAKQEVFNEMVEGNGRQPAEVVDHVIYAIMPGLPGELRNDLFDVVSFYPDYIESEE